jgi:hypothetical protein
MSANVLPDKVWMVIRRICIRPNLILCTLGSHGLRGYPVSFLLGLDICYPLIMLKALSERHGTASICHPFALKHWLFPTACNANWHFATGVQDVPTIQCTLLARHMCHTVYFTICHNLIFDHKARSLTMTAKAFLWID